MSRQRVGRRASHTPDELRELILAAATELIEEKGLVCLSAREIARRVGYSPGTIYNVFRDLDDVIFTIESRMLDALAVRIAGLPRRDDPVDELAEMAAAYLAFSLDKPRMWNLLVEHVPQPGTAAPVANQNRIDQIIAVVERIVQPLMGATDPIAARRVTAVLWSGVHGISTLAAAEKLPRVTAEDAVVLVDDLVRTYVRGLVATLPGEPPRKRRKGAG